jgi:methylisocitrate lyase
MDLARQLRTLLERPEIIVLPGVYDCLGAKLVEQLGFEVVFTSGFGISASTLGMPDVGLLTATETLYSVDRMASTVNIPLVADLDTGYGNPVNVIRTVTDAIRSGVAGIILEDQQWPKKCGHFQGKQVISMEEHVEKIKAAAHARDDGDLVIIARTDARASEGLQAAIRRSQSYYEAGADVLFVEAPQSVEELQAIAAAFPDVPLFVNAIEGGKTPVLSSQQLQDMGFDIVVYPLAGLFAATQAMKSCFQHLKENGTTVGWENPLDFQEFEKLIDVPHYRELESKFAADEDNSEQE